jgi:hypothetical protein
MWWLHVVFVPPKHHWGTNDHGSARYIAYVAVVDLAPPHHSATEVLMGAQKQSWVGALQAGCYGLIMRGAVSIQEWG